MKNSKRILSLDGGGIRGVISLSILEKIETNLRLRYNNPNYKLCDYFDLIGGTSTGAIIAAGLSIGMSVKDIENLYSNLGPKIFKTGILKRILSYTPLRSAKFSNRNIEQALDEVFADIELGSDAIKTGLCIFTKRIDTQSFWTIYNHPGGKFFDSKYGTNSKIKVSRLIQSSAAAPTYFTPINLDGGGDSQDALFVDGGVSMANNPSFQLYMLATMNAFPYNWEKGEDKLMIVSVGTGINDSKPITASISKYWLLSWAKFIPSVLLQDANMQVEILMQYLSTSSTARIINSEIKTLENDLICSQPQFTYIRYNPIVTPELMDKLGIKKNINDIMKLEAYKYYSQLKEIGEYYAKKFVTMEHFKENFDQIKNGGKTTDIKVIDDSNLNFSKAMKKPIPIEYCEINSDFKVSSMEGIVQGKKGDYLIRGVRGELYICDRSIFHQTYKKL